MKLRRLLEEAWARPRLVALAALLAAVCLGPRIPLPITVPSRRFDLRIEDVMLVGLIAASVLRRPTLVRPARAVAIWIGVYLAVAIVGTSANVVLFGLDALRGATYLGKEIEYFVIFLIVASLVRSRAEAAVLGGWFVALGLLNALWVAVQLAFGFQRELFLIHPDFPVARASAEFGGFSYGPGLIGEISPLSAGMLFALALFFAFAAYATASRTDLRGLLVATALAIPIAHTQSRDSIGAAAVGIIAIAVLTRRWRRVTLGSGVIVALTLASLLVTGHASTTVERFARLPFSLAERIGIYERGVEAAPSGPATTSAPGASAPPPAAPASSVPSPADSRTAPPSATSAISTAARSGSLLSVTGVFWLLFGLGKGSPGFVGGIAGELHDNYIRLFIESGVLGLTAFIVLLVALAAVCWRSWRTASARTSATLALAMIASIVGFAGAAVFQDMFLPVIPNELFWALAGLAVAAAQPSATATTTPPAP